MKRIISIILTLTMILSLITVIPVQAASYDENSYTLTGIQVNDIIGIAKTQIGYMEGNNSSQLDGTVSGSGNYTKYAKELNAAGHGAYNPKAWCAYFVSWCAMKAGCLNSALPFFTGVKSSIARSKPYKSNGFGTYHAIKKYTFTKGSVFSKDYTPSNIENYKPRKGDIMVFKGHVGLVISGYNSSTNSFVIIEGNAGKNTNIVQQRTVYMNNSELVGFITPDYSTTTITPTHSHSYSYSNDTAHPHSEYKYCSCGTKEYTGIKKLNSSCKQCYPVGNVKLTRGFEKTKGTATFYRNSVSNATSYTLKVYRNDNLYNTYTMSSNKYYVSGLPSGEYYAILYARNTATGEERSGSCPGFKISDSYIVSYNANGGTNTPSSQTKIEDTNLTLTSAIPTKEGHIFKGWASSKNAITAQYQAGGIYTKNAKITLYAVWEPETYTVIFDTNGGTGIVADEKVTYGNTIKMPNSVIKDYAYLKGWSFNKNSANVDYTLNTDYKIKQNLTLYAVWGDASWDNEISTSLSGKGTQEEPYLISTAADLAYLANKVNTQTTAPDYEYYKLTDNINLNYSEWKPIGIYGNENQYFYGSFDGNGYTVSDMYITSANEGYIGLFGYVKDSEIKNLTVTGAIESISATSNVYIGGIVGYAAKTNIENIDLKYFNIADISAVFENKFVCASVGAVVGYATQCEIIYCSSTDCHIDIKDGSCYGGMIVGYSSTTNISYCTVDVSKNGLFSGAATANCLYLGGVCGNLDDGAIEKCNVTAPYFSNNIKAVVVECGGIAGGSSSGTIRFCAVNFTDKMVNSITTESEHDSRIGGIVGYAVFSPTIVDCKYDGNSISASCNSYGISVGGIVGELYAHSLNDNEAHINRCISNISGTLSGKALVGHSRVGGAIGLGHCFRGDTGVTKNIIVISNGINSYASRSGDLAYVGNTIGYNHDNVISIEKAYYNTEMNVTSSTGNIDTTGTARSKNTMNISFYKNVMDFEMYSSIENLKSNENAVWVLKNGELPELYYNCLNDITISKDIVNGTVTVDKMQAIDGETVTVTAIPNDNYVVNKIYVNGEEKDSTFTVNGDCEIYVTFAEEVEEYNVSISANDNATGTLVNVDSTTSVLMSVMSVAEEDNSEITAKDGEEILINTTANTDYTVDTIYVNGEEIAGNSFILEDDSVITMDVASINTNIEAVTNDVVDVGCNFAVVSGSVSSEDENAVKYIRYWSADNTETIYTTDVEVGSGYYTFEIEELEPETTYYYQMTETGEVKSFTTCEEPIDEFVGDEYSGEDENESQPITTTTYKTLTSTYKFSIECSQALTTEFLAIACYDEKGKLLVLKQVECDGDTSYTASVPINTDIDYAKVFVWSSSRSLKPLAGVEIVNIIE